MAYSLTIGRKLASLLAKSCSGELAGLGVLPSLMLELSDRLEPRLDLEDLFFLSFRRLLI